MFFLKAANLKKILDHKHLTHREFALQLGISRGYLGRLLHRERHLTPKMRQALLRCPCLHGVPESELWEYLEAGGEP